MSTDDPDLARVRDLYIGWSVAERLKDVPAPGLGFSDLVAFLLEGRPLSAAQQAALFRSKHLRDQFQRLKEDLALRTGTVSRIVGLPAARAAADDTEMTERSFDDGIVTLVPSAVPNQTYIIITLQNPDAAPTRLLVESRPPGEVASTLLQPPDPDGAIRLLKDIQVEADALLLRLLRTPTSEGTFLV